MPYPNPFHVGNNNSRRSNPRINTNAVAYNMISGGALRQTSDSRNVQQANLRPQQYRPAPHEEFLNSINNDPSSPSTGLLSVTVVWMDGTTSEAVIEPGLLHGFIFDSQPNTMPGHNVLVDDHRGHVVTVDIQVFTDEINTGAVVLITNVDPEDYEVDISQRGNNVFPSMAGWSNSMTASSNPFPPLAGSRPHRPEDELEDEEEDEEDAEEEESEESSGRRRRTRTKTWIDHSILPEYRTSFRPEEVARLTPFDWKIMKYYINPRKRCRTIISKDTTNDWCPMRVDHPQDPTNDPRLRKKPNVGMLRGLIKRVSGEVKSLLESRDAAKKAYDKRQQAKKRARTAAAQEQELAEEEAQGREQQQPQQQQGQGYVVNAPQRSTILQRPMTAPGNANQFGNGGPVPFQSQAINAAASGSVTYGGAQYNQGSHSLGHHPYLNPYLGTTAFQSGPFFNQHGYPLLNQRALPGTASAAVAHTLVPDQPPHHNRRQGLPPMQEQRSLISANEAPHADTDTIMNTDDQPLDDEVFDFDIAADDR